MTVKLSQLFVILFFLFLPTILIAQDDFLEGLNILDKALYYDMEGADPAKAEALVREYLSSKYKFISYTVLPGETYWDLSERSLGDRFAWPLIWFINRDKYPDPDFLSPGSVILIPEPK